jgi:para-nitrobenzyl esterase
VQVFRGIPYAGDVASPERRFKAPPPPPSWTGVRDATRYGAPSIQPTGGPAMSEPAPAENCLFLNVWTPAADVGRRPVMFYCHGGGFTVGSGGRIYQNGANLAREQNVVVVESNHRLGLFGYLYLGDLLGAEYQGNQGLLDLVAALSWVSGNIASFGGDPHNVMVFGESGGGGKATCLYAMPSADKYFHKASIESPIGPTNFQPAEATEVAREAMRAFGLSDPRKLLEVPADQFLQFQTGGADQSRPGARDGGKPPRNRDQKFWPIIDGKILPGLPFDKQAPKISANKPLIIGGCRDEAVFFNLGNPAVFKLDAAGLHNRLEPMLADRTQAWIDTFSRSRPGATPSELFMAITTATPWRAHAVHIAEIKASQHAAPAFSYILDYRSSAKVPGTDYPIGSPHASDIPTKFDNVDPSAPAGGGPFGDNSPERKKAAVNMSAMWAEFARTGVPAAPGQPQWKPYTIENRETMLIDAECRLVQDPEGDERRFWEGEASPETIR